MALWKRISYIFAFLVLSSLLQPCASTAICKVRDLENSKWNVPEKLTNDLDMYIYHGLEYTAARAFTDIYLKLNLTDSDTYDLYKGDNCTAVEEDYLSDNRMFGLLKGVDLWKSHQLNVFNDTVVGIVTRLPYSIHVKVLKVNYIRLGAFLAGIVLFLFARRLVRNAVFFYGSGCSFGLLASLLIVVFIVYRFAPKKLIGIPILIGGWSLSMYMLHFAWRNFATVLVQYQKYLAAYVVTVVLISLAICYKKGPPKDSRSLDLAQWTMQGLALLLIYASSQVQEVSVGVMTILVLHQLTRSWLWYFLSRVASIFGFIWRRVFPPRRRLLTLKEYEKEGEETTKRELERLRQYCRSPDADVWKIASKVHDPRRFARFVDGKERHVLEEEEELYESDAECLDRDDAEDVEDDYDDRSMVARKYYEEDIDSRWDDDEMIIKRTPRNRSNYVVLRKSPFNRSDLPRNGPRIMEHTSNARSSYYRDSPRSGNVSRRMGSPASSASSSRRAYTGSEDYVDYDSESSIQKHRPRQEPMRRAAASSSKDFLSSDSDQDIQESDLYPNGSFAY